ncbi:MAG: hypothetical protein IJH65_07100 [Methanobrevibacter sp.]|nr:hypothetical protein [Methanobrevibacter sp.]MBQ6754192.1 hypothetical protein [Bacteroidales bacterium]MBR0351304.1 hypothetical protein [Clostridia bacterium]
MEDEKIVDGTPTETMESDDDFFNDVDDEVLGEESQESSEEETNEDSEPSETQEDNSEDENEVDFKPLLEELSKKVKYNKENVTIENLEDLINGYQKGLNYDKKVQELENLQNSKAEVYLKKKADELGISVDEYMDQVEAYEKQQKAERDQERLEEMIESGVPEELAKEVIATAELRRQLQLKENELKEKEKQTEAKEKEEKEYQDFLKNFPDVNPEDIPKEVFEEAVNSDLSSAYMKYKMKDLENQLKIAKQNEENSASTVGGVTNTGTTKENHISDPFLEGFSEEEY